MDAAGVEKQVLSPNHPPYLPDEKECSTATQMLNDGYTELAHRPFHVFRGPLHRPTLIETRCHGQDAYLRGDRHRSRNIHILLGL
jgi:hypothetical protein